MVFGFAGTGFHAVPQRHAFGDVFDFQYDAFTVPLPATTGLAVMSSISAIESSFRCAARFFPECRFDEFPGVRILHRCSFFVARLADLEKAGAVVEFGRQHMGGVFPGHPVIGRDVDEAAGGVVHDQRILFEQLLAAVFIGQFRRNVFLRADDNRNFPSGAYSCAMACTLIQICLPWMSVIGKVASAVGFPAGYFPGNSSDTRWRYCGSIRARNSS